MLSRPVNDVRANALLVSMVLCELLSEGRDETVERMSYEDELEVVLQSVLRSRRTVRAQTAQELGGPVSIVDPLEVTWVARRIQLPRRQSQHLRTPNKFSLTVRRLHISCFILLDITIYCWTDKLN